MDILLVLGSVTAKQYDVLRLAMLRRGMKPKIVRADTKLSTFNDFVNLIPVEHFNAMSPDEVETFVTTTEGEQVAQIFGDYSLSDVRAVIWEPSTMTDHSTEKMSWLIDRLPSSIVHYALYEGENGEVWIDGDGYGHLMLAA
jgi:hypothetical protein